MLAKQLELDDSTEVPANRLKLVGERPLGAEEHPPERRGRLRFIGNVWDRVREQVRQQPERYAHLADRLIVLLIAVVLAVSAYILILADPT
jgi:hypothetical protein